MGKEIETYGEKDKERLKNDNALINREKFLKIKATMNCSEGSEKKKNEAKIENNRENEKNRTK